VCKWIPVAKTQRLREQTVDGEQRTDDGLAHGVDRQWNISGPCGIHDVSMQQDAAVRDAVTDQRIVKCP
jgi:hypothetical protein